MAKQTPQQYLSQHEQILFDQSSPTTEPQDYSNEVNENGKRRSPDRLVLYSKITVIYYIEIKGRTDFLTLRGVQTILL